MDAIRDTFIKHERPVSYLAGGVASCITAALLYRTPLHLVPKILFSAAPLAAAIGWHRFGATLTSQKRGTETIGEQRVDHQAKAELSAEAVKVWADFFNEDGLQYTPRLRGDMVDLHVRGIRSSRNYPISLPVSVFNSSRDLKSIFVWERSKLEKGFDGHLNGLIHKACNEAKSYSSGFLDVFTRDNQTTVVRVVGTYPDYQYQTIFSHSRDAIIEDLDFGRNLAGLVKQIRAFQDSHLSYFDPRPGRSSRT